MRKSPYINSLCVFLYILAVAFFISNVDEIFGNTESFLAPASMLSLFVLSVSLMGLLFVYPSGELLFKGEYKNALSFLLKTIGSFAILTLLLFLVAILVGI